MVVVIRVHRKHRVKVLIHIKHVIWLIVTYSANTQNTQGNNTYADADKKQQQQKQGNLGWQYRSRENTG